MGAVLAEFFTPLRLRKACYDEDDWYEDEDEDDSDSDAPPAKLPFVVSKGVSPTSPNVEWVREPLYDSTRGQIGLAWSIFKVHGTPNAKTWPVRAFVFLRCRKQRQLTDSAAFSLDFQRAARRPESDVCRSPPCGPA